MAYEQPGVKLTGLTADADLSTKQFYFVKMSATNRQVSLCDTDGEAVIGVLQNKPNASGVAAEVMANGISKIEAGETIVAGDFIGTDSAGKAKKIEETNTGADIGDHWYGQCIEGAASGELITVAIGFQTGRTESA